MQVLIDGFHGVCVPQAFAEAYNLHDWGISTEDINVLLAGPEHPDYWDVWDLVLYNASFTDEDGTVWTLYQDGDLFAVESGEEINF